MAGSADAATAEQRRQFDVALGLAQPGIEAGDTARDQLLNLLGIGGDGDAAIDVIRNTPGFQFQTEQGTRALNASRSAGGTSGGTLIKDFARFNQGTAASFYQDYANRLANLAGTGQTAANQAGNQAIATGRGVGNTLMTAGGARASGILGQGNAFQNLIQQLTGAAGTGAFNNLFGASSGGTVGQGGRGLL
jgi:hypothetical protein